MGRLDITRHLKDDGRALILYTRALKESAAAEDRRA